MNWTSSGAWSPSDLVGDGSSAGLLARHVVGREGNADPGIVLWIPATRVDAVADPDESVAEGLELGVEPEATLGRDDVRCVRRAHRHDAISDLDRTGEGVRATVGLERVGAEGQSIEPATRGPSLVAQCVDREHRRIGTLEEAEYRPGVPVVAVDDIGLMHPCQCGDGRRESEEAIGIVRPALTLGVRVGMRTVHSRYVHERDRTHPLEASRPGLGRACPRRYVEVDHLLGFEHGVGVVGHDELHRDTEQSELANEAGRRLCEAADRYQR